jgi:hypothetical protein
MEEEEIQRRYIKSLEDEQQEYEYLNNKNNE